MDEDLVKTNEIVDQYSLIEKGKSGDHTIYLCPNCINKKGTEDDIGKLYWSESKEMGWCFRCVTAFFPEVDENEEGASEKKLTKAAERVITILSDKYINKFPEPKKVEFSFDEINPILNNYLRIRNPFLPKLIEILGIKAWYGAEDGVVVPFIYKDFVAKYQVRFPARKKNKYYTSPGPKLLYSPQHIFSDFKLVREDTITICEGVYDAIALMLLGYPNPIAILGSSITEYQHYLIKKLTPSSAFISMDNNKLNKSIEYDLKRNVRSIGTILKTVLSEDLDPEEYLVSQLSNKEFLEEVFLNFKEITS